jgi:hypothetical protein
MRRAILLGVLVVALVISIASYDKLWFAGRHFFLGLHGVEWTGTHYKY